MGARQGPSQAFGLADTASNVEGFGTSPLAPTAEHQRLLQTTSGITIANSNSNLQWIGRVITGKSDTRVFDWGGCAVRMRITGTTKLGLVVKEFLTHRYQMNVNSIPVTIVQTNNKTTQFALLSNLNPSTTYDIEVYKVSEAGSIQRGQSDIPNYATVYGFTADSTVKTLPFSTAGQRKLLFVGDSFTFGSGTMPGRKPLGNDPVYNCRDIPDYYPSASNYWSWGAILCREIKGACQYIGRGGRGLVANSDGTMYPRTLPHLIGRTMATVVKMDWSQSNFQPEAIFVTVGQNDFRDTNWKSVTKTLFVNTYATFIGYLRSNFPKSSKIFVGCGPMSQTKYFCPYLTDMVNKMQATDPNIYLLDFRVPNLSLTGCLDHPTWAENLIILNKIRPVIMSIIGGTAIATNADGSPGTGNATATYATESPSPSASVSPSASLAPLPSGAPATPTPSAGTRSPTPTPSPTHSTTRSAAQGGSALTSPAPNDIPFGGISNSDGGNAAVVPSAGTRSGTNNGAIAGGVVAGIAGVALVAAAALLLVRHRRRQYQHGSAKDSSRTKPAMTGKKSKGGSLATSTMLPPPPGKSKSLDTTRTGTAVSHNTTPAKGVPVAKNVATSPDANSPVKPLPKSVLASEPPMSPAFVAPTKPSGLPAEPRPSEAAIILAPGATVAQRMPVVLGPAAPPPLTPSHVVSPHVAAARVPHAGLVSGTSSSTTKAQVGKSADTAETKQHRQHHGADTRRDHRSSSRGAAPDRDHDRSRSRGRRDRERDRERSHRQADDRRKSTVSAHTEGSTKRGRSDPEAAALTAAIAQALDFKRQQRAGGADLGGLYIIPASSCLPSMDPALGQAPRLDPRRDLSASPRGKLRSPLPTASSPSRRSRSPRARSRSGKNQERRLQSRSSSGTPGYETVDEVVRELEQNRGALHRILH